MKSLASPRLAIPTGLLLAVIGAAWVYSSGITPIPNLEASTPAAEARLLPAPPPASRQVFSGGEALRVARAADERRRFDLLAASTGGNREEVEDVILLWPLAMQRAPNWPELAPEQITAIQAVGQSFARSMHGAGDPSSQEYIETWIAEQQKADEMLMVYLGADLYNRLHPPEE